MAAVSGKLLPRKIADTPKAYANITAYALKNNLNASNVTSGTLPVSFGGTGLTTLNNNQILIGNGTNSVLQSPNLIWDNTSNGLGIGTTQLFNPTTSFQVNNRRLWIDSIPNSSITTLGHRPQRAHAKRLDMLFQ